MGCNDPRREGAVEEMTIEQQRAVALARARLRAKQQGPSADKQISQDAITREAMDTKDASQLGFVSDLYSKADALSRPVREMVSKSAGGLPWVAAARDFEGATKMLGEQVDKAAYNAGGAVTDMLAGKVSPETAAKAGFAANLGVQTGATLLGGEAMKGFAMAPSKAAAKSLMKGALKAPKPAYRAMLPGTNMSRADSAVETMLQGGINVSEGGIKKLAAARNKLSGMIDDAIKMSSASVDKDAVATRAKTLLDDFYLQLGDSRGDIRAIENAINQFKAGISGKDIPVQLAQKMKRATDRVLGDVYGKKFRNPAGTEAQSALRLAMKEEIAKATPGVDDLNRAQQKVLNAMDMLENRQAVAMNTNPLGLSFLAENPFAAAGFAFDKSSLAKSILANILYGGSIPRLAGTTGAGILSSRSGLPPE